MDLRPPAPHHRRLSTTDAQHVRMTGAQTQAPERRQTRRAPVVLPEPTPGTILRQRVAQAAEDAAVRLERSVSGDPLLVRSMLMEEAIHKPQRRESGSFTGAPELDSLALTREDKSTCDLYLHAVARVRDAYAIQEIRLTEAERELAEAWSVHGMARLFKLRKKIESQQRRIRSYENCSEGKVCVHRFACPKCGQMHDGPPLTCNQRTCPNCVPKLRAQNIAHVLELLEGVDKLRQQKGQRTPRWRFVTLTVRSFDEFVPMRRFMAKAWGKLIRHRWWQRAVGAAVVCWETTHTESGWHVHLHALVDAFIPRELLVRSWEKVTGGLGQAAGVHVSEPKGGRRSIARELAKYVAKDLGGVSSEQVSEWGVAGTADRLAEFLDGSFRWRTLRTYGDAYKIADQLKAAGAGLHCEECDVGFEHLATVWLTIAELEALRSARRAPRPAQTNAQPAAP